MATSIELIVGLGNPGAGYQATRHNAGAWYVDRLAQQHQATFKLESRFHAEIAKITINGDECRLLKPATFMNHSGRAVSAASNYFKIPVEKILVVHDELDLPPGTARLKKGGGHGGHNGLRDIVSALGNEFYRLRIGIGHPGSSDQVSDYVLSKPSVDERTAIIAAIEDALAVFPQIIEGQFEKAMHQLHSSNGNS